MNSRIQELKIKTNLEGFFFEDPEDLSLAFAFFLGFSGVVVASVTEESPGRGSVTIGAASEDVAPSWVLVSPSPPLILAEDPPSAAVIPAAPIPFFWSDSSVMSSVLRRLVSSSLPSPSRDESNPSAGGTMSGFFFLDLHNKYYIK